MKNLKVFGSLSGDYARNYIANIISPLALAEKSRRRETYFELHTRII